MSAQTSETSASRQTPSWPGTGSTPESPTSPVHYLILESVFSVGLAGVVELARRRTAAGADPFAVSDLPVLAIATFALADVVAKEKVSTWIREPFVKEGADHKPVAAEGTGMQHAIGELLTCTRCVGTWSALGLVGLRVASPTTSRIVSGVLALSGVNAVMQSGFRLLTERTNREALANEQMRRAGGGRTEEVEPHPA